MLTKKKKEKDYDRYNWVDCDEVEGGFREEGSNTDYDKEQTQMRKEE